MAYWQRGIAVEQRGIAQQNEAQAKDQRDKATRNFKLAQKTAESLVFDIAQGLRDVQGMRAEAVRKILETAKGTFEQLTASAPEDLALQRSRAAMLSEFGRTYLGSWRSGAGAHGLPRWPSHHGATSPAPTRAIPGGSAICRRSYNKIGDVLVGAGQA